MQGRGSAGDDDWIPGDRGYITNVQNSNLSENDPNVGGGAYLGENIIYLGGCFDLTDNFQTNTNAEFFGFTNAVGSTGKLNIDTLANWKTFVSKFPPNHNETATVDSNRDTLKQSQ